MVVINTDGDSKAGFFSDYEQKRLENIKKNREMLSSLGVFDAAIQVKPKTPSVRRKRKKIVSSVTRQSRRLLKKQPEYDLDPDKLDKLDDKVNNHHSRNDDKPSGFESLFGKIFFDTIRGDTRTRQLMSSSLTEYADNLSKLSMEEKDNFKLLQKRVTSLAMIPHEKLVMVCGAKDGEVGIKWHEETRPCRTFRPHQSPITTIKSLRESFTISSYDGLIDMIDIETFSKTQVYQRIHHHDFTRRIYGFDYASCSNTHGLVCHGDGLVFNFDVREAYPKDRKGYPLHDDKIFSIHFNPIYQNYVATCGVDRSIRIWDIRKLDPINNSPVTVLDEARKGVTCAYFSPDGDKLLSTSLDNHLRVHIGAHCNNSPALISIPHNNHTGRWLSKLEAVWDPKNSDIFYCGSMQHPRQIECYAYNKNKIPVGVANESDSEDEVITQLKNPIYLSHYLGDDSENDKPGSDKYAISAAVQGVVFRIMQFQHPDYMQSAQSLLGIHHTRHAIVGANSSGRTHWFYNHA